MSFDMDYIVAREYIDIIRKEIKLAGTVDIKTFEISTLNKMITEDLLEKNKIVSLADNYLLIDSDNLIALPFVYNFRNEAIDLSYEDYFRYMKFIILDNKRILYYGEPEMCVVDYINKTRINLKIPFNEISLCLHPTNKDFIILCDISSIYQVNINPNKSQDVEMIGKEIISEENIKHIFGLKYNKEYILCLTFNKKEAYPPGYNMRLFNINTGKIIYCRKTLDFFKSFDTVEINKNLILICIDNIRIFEIHINQNEIELDIFIPKVVAPRYKLIDIFEANMFALLKNKIQLEFYHKREYTKVVKMISFEKEISENIQEIPKDREKLSNITKEKFNGLISINIINLITKFLY